MIYNFKIIYIKRIENTQANTLSRKPEYLSNKIHELRVILKQDSDILIFNKQQLVAITRVIRDLWIVKIIRNYLYNTIVTKYQNKPSRGFIKTEEGLLIFIGKVYILMTLRTELVIKIYKLLAYRHQGIRKTKE